MSNVFLWFFFFLSTMSCKERIAHLNFQIKIIHFCPTEKFLHSPESNQHFQNNMPWFYRKKKAYQLLLPFLSLGAQNLACPVFNFLQPSYWVLILTRYSGVCSKKRELKNYTFKVSVLWYKPFFRLHPFDLLLCTECSHLR